MKDEGEKATPHRQPSEKFILHEEGAGRKGTLTSQDLDDEINRVEEGDEMTDVGEGLKPTSNSALKGAQGSKRRSAINATAEVQINVNGENMLVTVESLDRTIPKHL